MLILFDIDGTLLQTHGAGLRAMAAALADLHGPGEYAFDGIDTSGRLDSHIWRDLCRVHGLPQDEASHDRFRLRYEHHLADRFRGDAVSVALPGTHALVDRLHAESSLTLGLLTGNYPATGRLKVEHAGFDPSRFPIGAFAVDGPDRRALPPVAMQRFAAHRGEAIDPRRVLIIGDTPLDVDCARANGCRCLAVATGRHPHAELASLQPDRVEADLSDTDAILRWILGLGTAAP
jgi:phosphoglycolate phosphatase